MIIIITVTLSSSNICSTFSANAIKFNSTDASLSEPKEFSINKTQFESNEMTHRSKCVCVQNANRFNRNQNKLKLFFFYFLFGLCELREQKLRLLHRKQEFATLRRQNSMCRAKFFLGAFKINHVVRSAITLSK